MVEYSPQHATGLAGMILASEDSISEQMSPERLQSRVKEYVEKLAPSYQKVGEALEAYLTQLPPEDLELLGEISGIYSGKPEETPKDKSEQVSKIIATLIGIEKEKGLLRKLTE